MHVIAAKAVGFKHNLSDEWKVYAKQVKANAAVLADVLMKRGYDVVSDGTDNHLLLIDLIQTKSVGKEAMGKPVSRVSNMSTT